ncbi:sensor histidine kinase [Shimia thalassica]|uniref:sensor histidine kinase n=1 Tax=Shimia thalassica TaxID=1715693 RepID=UPI00269BCAAA|nr:cache domain-containing protein [Shimia thalassica]MDP2518200.1 cache domain-containing protein [Shimia thalassica]
MMGKLLGSVRLRLLVLALLPLIVLMPLLLLMAMTRWTSDYDKVLIANVESDLRIAEQYLGQIILATGTNVRSLAGSVQFEEVIAGDETEFEHFLAQAQWDLSLDFLYFLPLEDAASAGEDWPVIGRAARGELATNIDIFSGEDLRKISVDLLKQARLPLIDTEAAVPTTRKVEDRGMVVHTASPVRISGHEGVLIGGILLNRNLQFIDTINALVYRDDGTGEARQGTATLFLDDVRISTNVRLFEDVRALGTRVSAAVRSNVLGKGQTWLNRAFVVNDWYISGYLPLTDSFGERVGMLYVGFLEAPFATAKRSAYWTVLGAFIAVLTLSVPVFLLLAKGIFSPLERMTQTMKKVEAGDLNARNGDVGTGDEIGQVAAHLDTLLNQIQERDQALRSWADELNDRVERRTGELRDANIKLEETFKQLVMSEKLASIGEITAGVAHEINNPVAVIQGNVDVMRQTLPLDVAREVETEMDLIDQQVQRIDVIVGKLLQFARPSEFGSQEESVDLSVLIRDCLVLVDHVLSKQDITVQLQIDTAPLVCVAPGEMQQVIINLIINATQAMEGRGTLMLYLDTETRGDKTGARLRVADTGPGLPGNDMRSVFDPFYTTKLGEGTGLGLSISQTLVQRAKGLISVENRPEGGAEFTVWLPPCESAL